MRAGIRLCSSYPDSFGLGFNRDEPYKDNPYPDAWCDECEKIRVKYGGWNEQSEKFVKGVMLCSGCYERAHIRNTPTSFTLADLADHRWKCGMCEEWYTGPALDYAHKTPDYWRKEWQWGQLDVPAGRNYPPTFLDTDYFVIEDRDFFVRGVIHLPIIGTAETLLWGVWGSLSRENFEKLFRMDCEEKFTPQPPMFSWLCNNISAYPETLSLKMQAHAHGLKERPHFELELTNHPLSQEFHKGITPQRVKEIRDERLGGNS